jgi:hypothetical protein
MFYDQNEVDSYLAVNLYGGVGEGIPQELFHYRDLKYFDLNKIGNESR